MALSVCVVHGLSSWSPVGRRDVRSVGERCTARGHMPQRPLGGMSFRWSLRQAEMVEAPRAAGRGRACVVALSSNRHGTEEAPGSPVRRCPERWGETDMSLDSRLGRTNCVEYFVISRRENVKPLGELSQERAGRLAPPRWRWCSWV